jgi:hypothetical protein
VIDLLWVFLRGFVQVAPVSMSTYFVSHDRPVFAVIVSWWISFIWWWNAGSASHLYGLEWAMTYATGAALGTWAGHRLARILIAQ